MFAYGGQGAVKVAADLLVHQQPVRSRLGKVGDVAVRLLDHQVYIQRKSGHAAHSCHNGRPKGDIRHKVPVHHIDVTDGSAATFRGRDLIRKMGEIRCQDGECKVNHYRQSTNRQLPWCRGDLLAPRATCNSSR